MSFLDEGTRIKEETRMGGLQRRAGGTQSSVPSLFLQYQLCRVSTCVGETEAQTRVKRVLRSINSEHTVRSTQGHREWQSGGNFLADMYDTIWGIPDAFSCVSLGD